MPAHPGLVALTAVAVTGLLPADGPTRTRYRIEQSISQELDATAAGGTKQTMSFTTTSFVTVLLSDSAGGKLMRVVVDSVRADSAAPVSTAVLDSARGVEFRAFVEPSGKPTRLVPANRASTATEIQGLLSDFFPWTRAGLRVGDRWSDTTATTSAEGSDSVIVRRVSAYQAAGAETRNARKAVRVTENFTASVAGSQPTPEGPARIKGSGKGSGSYYVSADGRYLGGSWQQQSWLTISGSFAPKPLPIHIVQEIKVNTLK